MNGLYTAALAVTLMVLVAPGAHAQATAPVAGADAIPRETAPATSLGSKSGSLSDKLGSTNGVITPQGDVDPAMHKPPPQAGNMPVLKPGEVPAQPSGKGSGGLY